MARKQPTQNAEPAAVATAPAAAEQLATQPAAPADNAAPATPPASTEQPTSEVPGVDAGSSGQDAHPQARRVGFSPPESGTDDEQSDDGDVEGLWITAIPEQGFRRCGYRFTREGTGIALSALSESEIAMLENEPNLRVERGVFSGLIEGRE